METELIQALGIGVGVCVVVALVVGAIRLSNATDAIWPNAATKYGLAFEEQKTGNAMTVQRNVKSLVGAVSGVPLKVVSTRVLSGNTRSQSTSFLGKSLHPAPHRFNLQIARGRGGGAQYHAVPTGDAQFDAMFSLRSDSPELVRALVSGPVRAAVRQLPMNEVSLAYDNGELHLSYGGNPLSQAELDAPISVVVALGQEKLA